MGADVSGERSAGEDFKIVSLANDYCCDAFFIVVFIAVFMRLRADRHYGAY